MTDTNEKRMASLFVGHPLDTIKVRLQSPVTATRYRGTLHAFRTILLEERTRGLYKGVTSPLAGAAFLNGLVFGTYGFLIRLQLSAEPDTEPTLIQVALAGAGTGAVASLITTPVELLKIRQQMMLSRSGLPSTRQVATRVFREEAIRGLYRGLTATCLRDLGFGVYFAAYESTCRLLQRRTRSHSNAEPDSVPSSSQVHRERHVNHASLFEEWEGFEADLSWAKFMIAGGVAGVTSWMSTFPFDAIKSRIQATRWKSPFSADFSRDSHPYNNTLSAFVHSYKTLGIRSLFAGLSPTLIRAIPVNMVTFLVFELIVGAVNRRGVQ